jgi:hypothetical protein
MWHWGLVPQFHILPTVCTFWYIHFSLEHHNWCEVCCLHENWQGDTLEQENVLQNGESLAGALSWEPHIPAVTWHLLMPGDTANDQSSHSHLHAASLSLSPAWSLWPSVTPDHPSQSPLKGHSSHLCNCSNFRQTRRHDDQMLSSGVLQNSYA